MVASTLQRNFNRWAGRTRLYTELKSWHGLNVCTGSGNPYFCPILSTIYTTKASTWGSISIGHCFRISISRVLGELGGGVGWRLQQKIWKVCACWQRTRRGRNRSFAYTHVAWWWSRKRTWRGERESPSSLFLFFFLFSLNRGIQSHLR